MLVAREDAKTRRFLKGQTFAVPCKSSTLCEVILSEPPHKQRLHLLFSSSRLRVFAWKGLLSFEGQAGGLVHAKSRRREVRVVVDNPFDAVLENSGSEVHKE